LWRFHIPDTSTNAAGNSTRTNLYTACAKTTRTATETIRATHTTTTTCNATAHGDICAWQSETRHYYSTKAATKATGTSLYTTNSASYNPDWCITIITDHACKKANHSQTSESASHVAYNFLG
jgi:hypothetical protein